MIKLKKLIPESYIDKQPRSWIEASNLAWSFFVNYRQQPGFDSLAAKLKNQYNKLKKDFQKLDDQIGTATGNR